MQKAKDPGSRALRLGPRPFSVRVVDSFGTGFVGGGLAFQIKPNASNLSRRSGLSTSFPDRSGTTASLTSMPHSSSFFITSFTYNLRICSWKWPSIQNISQSKRVRYKALSPLGNPFKSRNASLASGRNDLGIKIKGKWVM